MKKAYRLPLLLLATLMIANLGLRAQIPNGYYNNATGKTGDELKAALHDIIKGHHVVSYAGLLNAFAYTDCKPNGKIWDIYSNIEYSPSTGLCGDYGQEGDCWNREHTWPQSWFNESTTPRSDLFHVYPTDGYVNGQRSNYPYGEVNHPIYTSGNGSKLGPCVTSGYSGRVFEPIDEYKGDIARSYFYMSVRYSGEDDDWGSSNMTNKSEILPWAMTMLLRWSDEDPVSDKEIARNNAVYGYQRNRNPFIDHPEYARMIWDPTWTQGVSYNITCDTGLSHGSISAPESALEGSTVVISATPQPGYMVDTYTVYKTDSPNTTVTVSSNGTFIMPSYDVTVSATFVQNNTLYNIALGTVSHGSINASASTALSGTNITLTATPVAGYSLYSWYVFKTGDMDSTVNISGNSFVMPAFDVTVMATFVQGTVSTGDYVKVTTAPTDWSGEYLIVYEGGSLAFDGGLTTLDAISNTISVSISNNTIEANEITNAAKFTIAAINGGYSIQSASGYYIGQTSNANGLQASLTTVYTNSISYNNGNVDIVSGGAYLRYNNQSGQTRFRYFKSSTYTNQKAIQLYKKSEPTLTPTHTIHFNSNGGEGTMIDQTLNEFEPMALQANAFTREGFVFEGWNTVANGTGDYYADGATVTLLNDLTLYAQWNQLFSITLAEVSHGSISASATQAVAESEIVLTATPDPCYVLDHWMVTDEQGNAINVTENQFEMPASNVTVSVTFVENSGGNQGNGDYVKVTSAPSDWSGEYLLVYENDATSGYVWTGVDAANCFQEATITDCSIEDNGFVTITIAPMSGGYSIRVNGGTNDGKYIYGQSGNNTIRFGTSAALNTLEYVTDWVKIISNTSVMRFNNASGNMRFRYYKEASYLNTNIEPVQLYKKIEPQAVEQPISLLAGWSWWTPMVETTVDDLQTALGSNATIMAQNGMATGSLVGGQMYKIYTPEAIENLTLTGVAFGSVSITLQQGANWIGHTGMEAIYITALGITPAEGDMIVSQTEGFTIYQNGTWKGTLEALQPGHGYVYYKSITN